MNASREQVIQRLRENMEKVNEHYATAPDEFLNAWKEAVKKIGLNYFECQRGYQQAASIEEAADKWQLIPNYELMLERLSTCSPGEGVFMGVVYSFYNSNDSEQFLHAFDIHGLGDVAGRLDLDEIEIVTRLMLNHTGW